MTYDAKAENLAREAVAAKSLIEELRGGDDDFAHDVIEGETSLLEAIDAALFEMDDCAVIIDGCTAQIDALAARKAKAEKRKDRLRGLVEQSMVIAGLDTAKRPTATVTVRKVKPRLIVTDENQIPSKFWKQPDPVLDRKLLSASNEPVAGTTLSNGGTTLTIRRI